MRDARKKERRVRGRKPGRTPAEVQADLQLDELPDDGFMRLLAEVGDEDVVAGPELGAAARSYTPRGIEEAVIDGTVGTLLAQARSDSGRSLSDIGSVVGVTRARIQQIEHSDNIEVATLVRIAAACGYDVSIRLRPRNRTRRTLSATLASIPA